MAVLAPLIGTVVVHAAVWWGLVSIRIDPQRRRLTDAPAETVVTFTLPPEPAAPEPDPIPPPPEPPPPEPPPETPPETAPEPAAEAEPPAQPAEITTETIQAVPEPEPAPRPAPVAPAAPVRLEPRPVEARPPAPAPASFAGVQGPRAERIVYLVDASGPMTSSLPFVLAELDRSVSRLTAAQSFQVVVFREPPPGSSARDLEVFGGPSAGLVRASDDQKQRLRTWLAGIQPSGRSDPREALETGLAFKPELVFLLTRSIRRSGPDAAWAGGSAAVLESLDRLNPAEARSGRRPVVIKTIQFIDDDPTGLLKTIASLHGDGPGSYRVMRIEELPGE